MFNSRLYLDDVFNGLAIAILAVFIVAADIDDERHEASVVTASASIASTAAAASAPATTLAWAR